MRQLGGNNTVAFCESCAFCVRKTFRCCFPCELTTKLFACERNASYPCIHIDPCMQGGVISEPADCASNVKSIQRDCPPRECLGLFFRRECLVAGSLKNMFGYWWKICLGAYSGPTVGPRKNFSFICLPRKNSGDAISHV